MFDAFGGFSSHWPRYRCSADMKSCVWRIADSEEISNSPHTGESTRASVLRNQSVVIATKTLPCTRIGTSELVNTLITEWDDGLVSVKFDKLV
jgi:hypothetical protein